MPPKRGCHDVEDLRKELDRLQQRLGDKARKKRNMRRKLKRHDSPVTAAAWKVACVLHALTGCAHEQPIAYLHMRNFKLRMSPSEIEKALEAWFAGLSEEEKTQQTQNPLHPIHGASVRAAHKFLTEYAVHQWVENQNLNKGEAPGYRWTISRCRGRGTTADEYKEHRKINL